jgi:phosphoglycolate phosphatase-like HAD superfamily hydrolase
MSAAVILDLDQTLVDTSKLEPLRKSGNWGKVYDQIPSLKEFPEINFLLKDLNDKHIKTVIITTSPSGYCSKIVNHFGWSISGMICYHDVKPHIKPHPKAFLQALEKFSIDPNRIISAGDRDIDIVASKAAKIPSIACTWASPNPTALLNSKPEFVAHSSKELRELIRTFHKI